MGTILRMSRMTIKQRFAKEMGSRIRETRKGMPTDDGREMGLREMAKLIDEDFENYKKWDEGQAAMPHHVIPKFCAVTKCDPWYLLTGQHGGFTPNSGPPTPIPIKKRA